MPAPQHPASQQPDVRQLSDAQLAEALAKAEAEARAAQARAEALRTEGWRRRGRVDALALTDLWSYTALLGFLLSFSILTITEFGFRWFFVLVPLALLLYPIATAAIVYRKIRAASPDEQARFMQEWRDFFKLVWKSVALAFAVGTIIGVTLSILRGP